MRQVKLEEDRLQVGVFEVIPSINCYGRHEKRAADKCLDAEPPFPSKPTGKRNLKFQYKLLHRWNWLVYSNAENGAFSETSTVDEDVVATLLNLMRMVIARVSMAAARYSVTHDRSSTHRLTSIVWLTSWVQIR
ncbi:hypothetical protein HPB47_012666 [Ixodes persulcatus]|uniref:Uncharacterized protein n=1 Tax=Ixodes persulcatus TaxID=34615 RepID=A0AC60NSW3_IXOPE|nr:hypothetical protein HPB47_012666 [Ixodes persulcatus]